MKSVIFTDGVSRSWLTGIYIDALKTLAEDLTFEEIVLVEVLERDYLREDFFLQKNGRKLRLYFKKDSEIARMADRAARELKRYCPHNYLTLVISGEQEATCITAEKYSRIAKSKLFVVPVNEVHEDLFPQDVSVLAHNENAFRKLQTLFSSVFMIENILCPRIEAEKTITPSPYFVIGVFVDSENDFEKFRTVAKSLKRFEEVKITLFGSEKLVKKALDYAELVEASHLITVCEEKTLQSILHCMKNVNAVLSLSAAYLPLDAVVSLLAGKPVIAFENSAAESISEISSGTKIPALTEESIAGTLRKYVERYEFIDFDLANESISKITDVENFLEAVRNLV